MVGHEGSARAQRVGAIFPDQLLSKTTFLPGLVSIYGDC